MRLLPILALLSLIGLLAVARAQSGIGGVTQQYANQTLAGAADFVNLVNESGYLVFYPNLTQAYADLGRAGQFLNTSPSSSIVYANKAAAEAMAQYQIISRNRQTAAIVMLAISLLSGLALYRLSKPVAKEPRRRSK